MNIFASSILSILISYLIGSTPSAYIVGRLVKGIDIRKTGTGNMGAMNVFYKVGFWPGLLVGIMDAGKGALAVYVGGLLCQLSNMQPLSLIIMQLICGLAAILGHNYPAFLKFQRGGRGGATVVGILFFLIPLGIPFYILFFLLVLAITRFPTISYVGAFLVFPAIAWVQWATPVDSWIQVSLPAFTWMQSRASDSAQHIILIIYPVLIMLIPVLTYIPRMKEILSKAGGNFKKAAFHSNIKERL